MRFEIDPAKLFEILEQVSVIQNNAACSLSKFPNVSAIENHIRICRRLPGFDDSCIRGPGLSFHLDCDFTCDSFLGEWRSIGVMVEFQLVQSSLEMDRWGLESSFHYREGFIDDWYDYEPEEVFFDCLNGAVTALPKFAEDACNTFVEIIRNAPYSPQKMDQFPVEHQRTLELVRAKERILYLEQRLLEAKIRF